MGSAGKGVFYSACRSNAKEKRLEHFLINTQCTSSQKPISGGETKDRKT
jgi:hypothetical protein